VWNYSQDFVFGFHNSGKPAAVSFFRTEGIASFFFDDLVFGIEGSWMALPVSILFSGIIAVIVRRVRQRQSTR
jgi:Na+-driven multidrug efflux pump